MIPSTRAVPILAMLLLPVAHADGAAPQAPQTCTAAEHRQFDFWIGEWAVYTGDDRAGTDRISRVSGRCALLEEWVSTDGVTGTSLNYYDPQSGEWHQVWVGEAGGVILRMTGGLLDGDMVLATSEKRPTRQGPVYDRIRWHAQGAEVVQTWDISPDGEKWTTGFQGTYRRE